MALLPRTGIKGKGVLEMAHELLQLKTRSTEIGGFDGIAVLSQCHNSRVFKEGGIHSIQPPVNPQSTDVRFVCVQTTYFLCDIYEQSRPIGASWQCATA